ncbi:MAG: hypothetical protein H6Q58_2165 [Firmicutes bacterium]|nr:hypothetical protein [Bacillota bacterium]
MSAFLGKIHYWLYNKIQLHEDILDEVIRFAELRSIPVEALKDEADEKFGKPERGPLEDVINHGNIHGWLQSSIQNVENRTACVVTGLVKNHDVKIDEISEIYRESGRNAMALLEGGDFSPKELYIMIFDNMLEGMPCDRINEPAAESEEEFSWNTTRCLHKECWDNAEGEVENYYTLRDAWIEGFIGGKNTYSRTYGGMKTIRRLL